MVKRRGLITTIVLITLLAGINIFLFFNGGEISYNTVSGRLIEELPETIFNLDISVIIFALQWIVLALIIIIVYSKYLTHKKIYLTQQDYQIIKQKKTKSETDLDILYELLKSRKKGLSKPSFYIFNLIWYCVGISVPNYRITINIAMVRIKSTG